MLAERRRFEILDAFPRTELLAVAQDKQESTGLGELTAETLVSELVEMTALFQKDLRVTKEEVLEFFRGLLPVTCHQSFDQAVYKHRILAGLIPKKGTEFLGNQGRH